MRFNKTNKDVTRKMEWFKRNPQFLDGYAKTPCFIKSDNGFWRPSRCGYTDRLENAGVYTLMEAYNATCHSGPEKQVRFIFPSRNTVDSLTKSLIIKLNEIQKLIEL